VLTALTIHNEHVPEKASPALAPWSTHGIALPDCWHTVTYRKLTQEGSPTNHPTTRHPRRTRRQANNPNPFHHITRVDFVNLVGLFWSLWPGGGPHTFFQSSHYMWPEIFWGVLIAPIIKTSTHCPAYPLLAPGWQSVEGFAQSITWPIPGLHCPQRAPAGRHLY